MLKQLDLLERRHEEKKDALKDALPLCAAALCAKSVAEEKFYLLREYKTMLYNYRNFLIHCYSENRFMCFIVSVKQKEI